MMMMMMMMMMPHYVSVKYVNNKSSEKSRIYRVGASCSLDWRN